MDAGLWVAIAAVIIAAAGLIPAFIAIRHAGQAVEEAREANTIAEAADQRGRRLYDIQLERSDVEWTQIFDEASNSWVIENVGQDTAHDVQITLDIDQQRMTQDRDAVAPREPIRFDLTQPAHIARVASQETFERGISSGIAFISVPTLHIRQRISWRSEGGRPFLDTSFDKRVSV
ncbi:MAG: hypothetical protein QOI06_232 [Nocardioidaceae bacterium]|jgi:hypothetical protein|nr:hypothetical protein [Nocardioidaceae bacterium]